MKLIKSEIKKISLDFYQEELRTHSFITADGSPYQLLAYLSFLYSNCLIIDAGTYEGFSALALAQNKTNKVYTYDIEETYVRPILKRYENITFLLMDVNKETDRKLFAEAKIISLDIGLHLGVDEQVFYDMLKEVGFKGILICDDIKLNAQMIEFWDNIQEEKYDISSFGHFSGTGLVNFTDEKIEIYE